MRGSDRWPFALAASIAVLVASLNLLWLREHRLLFPLNYDEAAFMAMARYDTLRLATLGPVGLARAYVVQGPAAPLVPLASVPVQMLMGPSNLPSLGVIQGFLGLLTLATYGIGARLGGSTAGLLAAIAIVTAPGVIYFGRMYHYAVPSAAMLAAALYALLQSQGFRQQRWALVWGLTLGLMLLTRSVTLAILPGMVLAGAATLATGEARIRRSRNLALGLAVATAVAGTWYWRNLPIVLEYLTLGGYGGPSALYGTAHSWTSLEFWLARVTHLIHQGLYLPLAALLITFIIVGMASRGIELTRRRPTNLSPASLSGDHAVMAILLGASYVALSSSSNVGSGFVLLLLPPFVSLSAALVATLRSTPARCVSVGLVIGLAGFNLIMTSGLATPISEIRAVTLPVLGSLPLTDGRADIQTILQLSGYDDGAPSGEIPLDHTRWLEIDRELADELSRIAESHGKSPVAAFAMRDPLVTVGSVRLAGLIWQQRNLYLIELSGSDPDDSQSAYSARLAALSPQPNFLIAADPGPAEAPPRVTQEFAEGAARELGFELIRTIALPGNRLMRVWWRDAGPDLA